jgi:hypothetical protein
MRTQRRHQQVMRLAYLIAASQTGSTYAIRSKYNQLAANASEAMLEQDCHTSRHMANAMASMWYAINTSP